MTEGIHASSASPRHSQDSLDRTPSSSSSSSRTKHTSSSRSNSNIADPLFYHHTFYMKPAKKDSKSHHHYPHILPHHGPKPPQIAVTIESPPLVCYGQPKDSTGALMSVLLHLDVLEETQAIESFEVSLVGEIINKQPLVSGCPDCKIKRTVLNSVKLIDRPLVLRKGKHTFPYSYLIPGNTPASAESTLSSIAYYLEAQARPAVGPDANLRRPITISRSILPTPHAHRHSIRVFPPTNLSATVRLPAVVHPGGDFDVAIRLDGVTTKGLNSRWKLRRCNWRIEESSRMVATACSRHASKFNEATRSVLHEDARLISSAELKSGWKSDFSAADGQVNLEFSANIPPQSNAACNVETPDGASISHTLILEMIVAEEYVS